MYYFFNPLSDAIHILTESENPTRREELAIQTILEDAESPATNKYLEFLYDSVIEKSHIDFGNIPDSHGNIVEYSGYTNMIQVLENIQKLASDSKAQNVINYTNVVKQSIVNMRTLAPIYQRGYRTHNDYLILEYNMFVYTIIQATSTLLYEFVDYIKKPGKATIDITLKNTKYRANTYYIDQLNKFNTINKNMQYSKYLEAMLQNGKNNFMGVESMVGLGVVVAVSLAIIPILREMVYIFYTTKSNLSDGLAQQAYFLELNKTTIQANSDFSQKERDAIVIKQEKIKNLCIRLSDKLRVDHIKSVNAGKAAVQNDNKLLTIDTVKKEVNNSPLQLL